VDHEGFTPDRNGHTTVEDRILALQEKKRELVETALDETAGRSIARLGVRELGFLFVSPLLYTVLITWADIFIGSESDDMMLKPNKFLVSFSGLWNGTVWVWSQVASHMIRGAYCLCFCEATMIP
jgi:hypothetical protein